MSIGSLRLALALSAVAASAGMALPAAASAPARMLVTAREWSLTLSRGTVPPGAVTVQLYDRGQDAHNLAIRRVGAHNRLSGPAQTVAITQSGSLTQASWHLGRGRYELYCSLPGHAKLGMRAFVTVR